LIFGAQISVPTFLVRWYDASTGILTTKNTVSSTLHIKAMQEESFSKCLCNNLFQRKHIHSPFKANRLTLLRKVLGAYCVTVPE